MKRMLLPIVLLGLTVIVVISLIDCIQNYPGLNAVTSNAR